jgi:nicotinamide mononucleotide transporter
MINIFDVNTTLFTVMDYQMSYIEFFGTLFTIWCVWLTVKAKVLSWPVGIVGSILYLFLFYQIQLYSDLFEQTYFIITSLIGWWLWLNTGSKAEEDNNKELKISRNTWRENLAWGCVIASGTALFMYLTVHLHVWMPQYFPEPTSFPFLDAFTTAMSFTAQWLLVRKKIESWVLWLAVDAIAIWLYWSKGVKFVSIEYMLFLILASKGLWDWIGELKNYEKI